MSRPRGYAAEDAKKAFLKDIEHCMIDVGIKNKTELAGRITLDPRTLYRKFDDLNKFTFGDVSAIVKVLCPDPMILMKALGYKEKEIDRSYAMMKAEGGKLQ